MSLPKNIVDRLLNPRARLSKLGHTTSRSANEFEPPAGARSRLHPRDLILNPPLVVGSIIALGLFLIVLFGPRVSSLTSARFHVDAKVHFL